MKKLYFLFCLIPFLCTAQSTWTSSATGYDASLYADDIAVDGSGHAFVSTVFFDNNDFSYNIKLYTSTDDGANWSLVTTSGLPQSQNVCLAIKGNTLFMGTSSDIYKSTDGGSTWITTGFPTVSNQALNALGIDDSGILWAATTFYDGSSNYYQRIYYTAVAGSSWIEITTTGLPATGNNFSSAFDVKGSQMYMGVNDDIYSSTNGGSNWTLASTGYNTSLYPTDLTIADNGDVYVVADYYNNVTSTSSTELYTSSDFGATWSLVTTTGLPANAPSSISAKGSNMFMGINGIYKATDFSSVPTPIVNALSDNNAASIYPNPATTTVNISSAIQRIQLQDMLGVTVLAKSSVNSLLDISTLPNGVYMLQGFDQNNQLMLSERLVISKN